MSPNNFEVIKNYLVIKVTTYIILTNLKIINHNAHNALINVVELVETNRR